MALTRASLVLSGLAGGHQHMVKGPEGEPGVEVPCDVTGHPGERVEARQRAGLCQPAVQRREHLVPDRGDLDPIKAGRLERVPVRFLGLHVGLGHPKLGAKGGPDGQMPQACAPPGEARVWR